jgi:gliding motility-associated-like protein
MERLLVQGVNYFWSPASSLDNASLLTPKASPLATEIYTLHAISSVGCGSSMDEVFVKVYNDVYIPKAFSPNNDGLNDTWRIYALDVFPNAKTLVYNRYGKLVFEGNGNNIGWDGTFRRYCYASRRIYLPGGSKK